MKPVYRNCRECGKRVNVSSQEKHGKKYICPKCSGEPWFMTREYMVREHTPGKGGWRDAQESTHKKAEDDPGGKRDEPQDYLVLMDLVNTMAVKNRKTGEITIVEK